MRLKSPEQTLVGTQFRASENVRHNGRIVARVMGAGVYETLRRIVEELLPTHPRLAAQSGGRSSLSLATKSTRALAALGASWASAMRRY